MFDASAPTAANAADIAAFMRRDTAFRALSLDVASPAGSPDRSAESAEDAYQRGLAEGQSLALVSHDVERRALLDLLANAEALQVQPCPQLADLMAQAVQQLVQQIVGDMPVDPVWLDARVAEASAIIADADADRILFLHPADITSIGDQHFGMAVRADPQVPRGGLRISAGDGWVEHGRPVYIDALRQALDAEGTAR